MEVVVVVVLCSRGPIVEVVVVVVLCSRGRVFMDNGKRNM